ncbi:hypothetical protein [Shewanella algae]|uniref:hypothetical protein n=1 Tax=Shewanella algae TaxID=38313 RepID=UPI001AAC523F|nr:hypothetical protein [Shewanella algae]MBO2643885.1 hypothetical protein [Shewanella algae]QTE95380.1 hypothetical protein JKK45_02065 [Shewanella algae]
MRLCNKCQPLEAVGKHWCEQVAAVPLTERVPALTRYKGAHWSIAKSCKDELGVELWIMSAGLGLVNQSTLVPDYQATFARGSEDSIPKFGVNTRVANQRWWRYLSEFNQSGFKKLFRKYPEDIFIVSGSKDYIDAIKDDLSAAIQFLVSPEEQLLIVTSGRDSYGHLDEFVLRSKSSMTKPLKSNMLTLNIALAKRLLIWMTDYPGKSLKEIAVMASSLARDDVSARPKGVRRDVQFVQDYLTSAIRLNPNLKMSPALREFRANGNSFEANRFKEIFQRIQRGGG